MNFKSKLALFFLFLSVLLTSSLAIRFPNHHESQREQLRQCVWDCVRSPQRQQGDEQRECIRNCKEDYGVQTDLVDVMIINARRFDEDDRRQQVLEHCRSECQTKRERGQRQEFQCEKRCVERFEERRQADDEDDNSEETYHHDSQQQQQQQQQRQLCQRKCEGERRETECRSKCQEELRRQQERGHFDDESENSGREHQQESYKICRQICESGRKQGERSDCQRKCQQAVRRQEEEGSHREEGDRRRQHHEECQRMCKHIQGGIECQVRCQKLIPRPSLLASFIELTGLF